MSVCVCVCVCVSVCVCVCMCVCKGGGVMVWLLWVQFVMWGVGYGIMHNPYFITHISSHFTPTHVTCIMSLC